MPNRSQSCLKVSACILLWGLAFSLPLWADEIVATTDENGRRIFINAGETPAKGGWRSNPPPAGKAGTAAPTPEISNLVEQTANRLQIDPQLVHAIIKVESQYDPMALSNKGAMGLMQLIPETAQRFGVANPFDPKDNIQGGVTYLKHLLDMFGGDLPLSLAAYNAGEGAVQRSGGIPSYAETKDYVSKVTRLYQSASSPTGTHAAPIVRYVDERGVVHYSNVE
jgi:soluble lytic murein transglycosylase-like protein